MKFEGSEDGFLDLKKRRNSFRYKGCFSDEIKYRKLNVEVYVFYRLLIEWFIVLKYNKMNNFFSREGKVRRIVVKFFI